jgi:hypothetical protein
MMSTQCDPPALHTITLGQCGGPDPSLVMAGESEVTVKKGGQQQTRKHERQCDSEVAMKKSGQQHAGR